MYRQALDEFTKTGSSADADRARQLQSYATRIRVCEDTAAAEKRTCGEEQVRRDIDNARQKGALVAVTQERDEEQATAAHERLELAEAKKKLEILAAEKVALTEERDALKAAAAKAAAALSAAPHPAAAPGAPAPIAGAGVAPPVDTAVAAALPPAALPPAPPPAALPPAALPPTPAPQ
jgi:hypothetical protein